MNEICFFRLLTDIQIKDINTARQAMEKLHQIGAKTVVISSSDLGTENILVALGSSISSMYSTCSNEKNIDLYFQEKNLLARSSKASKFVKKR